MRLKYLIFLAGLFFTFSSFAQNSTQHYYVIIGAFAKHENAIRYTDYANKLNFSAQYALNKDRNLFYVYILDTDEKRSAFAFLIKIKVETEFKQAWVYSGILGDQPASEKIESTPVKEEPVVVKEEPVVVTPKEEPKKDSIVSLPVVKTDSAMITKEVKPLPEGKPFYFKLTNGDGGSEVNGEVHVMTSAKAGQYQSFPVNQVVYIKAPGNGALQVSTLAPGYKEMKRSVNYGDPSLSAAEVGANSEAIIVFPLIRVNAGDYIEFNNVRFFQNSAILQPESKNEIDGLVDLMKENARYKIKIHAHCNGEKSRDIVSKGKSTNFFATEAGNVKESASAKKLTELRADLVKDYLISQGIEEGRIATKAEGGKIAIYPTNSTLAARNDRIEIEITKGK